MSRRRSLVGVAALVAAAAVAAALLIASLVGGDPFQYDDPFEPLPAPSQQGTGNRVESAPAPDRRLMSFLRLVTDDVQGFWDREFERNGLQYTPAQVVVFQDVVPTRCGPGSEATGPFYCPLDRRVYLDPDFFRALAVTFKAPGDFAQAYVIAHEIGHHVQNLTGIMGQVQGAMAEQRDHANELSIALELHADCLAGVWGHSTYERGLLERGDLDEGLRAAAAVGDDRIQARTTGRINPETWTHGSSEQRRDWFVRGFETGDPTACDTFAAGV
jgi:predicted metalloprotease